MDMKTLIGHEVRYISTKLENDGTTSVFQRVGIVTDAKRLCPELVKVCFFIDNIEVGFNFRTEDLKNDYKSHCSLSIFNDFETFSEVTNIVVKL